MKSSLVVTVVGPDRPGIVDAISEVAVGAGANWEGSRLVRLAGQFAGVALLTVDAERADALDRALHGLESRGLRVIVARADGDGGPSEQPAARLDLVGNDRPGIVQRVARALAARGVNVEELTTTVESAAMSGDLLFRATALLRLPAGADPDDLRAELERLGDDLMVDITLR